MTSEEKAQAVEVMAEAVGDQFTREKAGFNITSRYANKVATAALEALLRWQEERKEED